MARVCQHVFENGAKYCTICGTNYTQAAVGFTCIWRDVPDSRCGAIRPEPALRTIAAEDAETISARIAELRKEQEVVWNTIDPEPAPFPDDMGDCCL